jgi:hypothetical protein
MSYKDRYGITKIRDAVIDNLSISWDADCMYPNSPEDVEKKDRYPVFLYTPWMEDTGTHYHISLSKEEAKALKDWLEEYLKDVE